jgi:hypothetical protein
MSKADELQQRTAAFADLSIEFVTGLLAAANAQSQHSQYNCKDRAAPQRSRRIGQNFWGITSNR